MSGIRRRELITLFGGAASWPFVARAEQSARPVIGLMHATIQANDEFVAAFKEGLSQTGYVDGRNVSIEFRSAEGLYDRLPAIAAADAGGGAGGSIARDTNSLRQRQHGKGDRESL